MPSPIRAAEHCRPHVNADSKGSGLHAEGPIALLAREAQAAPAGSGDRTGTAHSPNGCSASAVRLIYPKVPLVFLRWNWAACSEADSRARSRSQTHGVGDAALAAFVAGERRAPAVVKAEARDTAVASGGRAPGAEWPSHEALQCPRQAHAWLQKSGLVTGPLHPSPRRLPGAAPPWPPAC